MQDDARSIETLRNDPAFKRVRWHSRRGMLELDLVLGPFVEERYPLLPPADQAAYRALLTRDDQDLYAWFLGRVPPDDPELYGIVRLVLDHTARQPRR